MDAPVPAEVAAAPPLVADDAVAEVSGMAAAPLEVLAGPAAAAPPPETEPDDVDEPPVESVDEPPVESVDEPPVDAVEEPPVALLVPVPVLVLVAVELEEPAVEVAPPPEAELVGVVDGAAPPVAVDVEPTGGDPAPGVLAPVAEPPSEGVGVPPDVVPPAGDTPAGDTPAGVSAPVGGLVLVEESVGAGVVALVGVVALAGVVATAGGALGGVLSAGVAVAGGAVAGAEAGGAAVGASEALDSLAPPASHAA